MNFFKKNPIIILIAGKARSGKGTVASYLEQEFLKLNKKVVISPYTKYLKKYIEEITGEELDEEQKPRDLLQKISSELIKKELGKKNFFIQRQIDDLEIYSYFMDVVLIPDVRFPYEIEEIRKRFSNVIAIGIERKEYISTLTLEQQNDITEVSLDDYTNYDYKLINYDEFRLQQDVLEIFNKINERGNKHE